MLSTASNPLVEDGGSSSNFPVARNGSSTTLSVAELIAVWALPSIGSFGLDVTAMRTLSPFHFPDDVYTPKTDSDTAQPERSAPVKTSHDGSGLDDATSCAASPGAPTHFPLASADHTHPLPKSQLEAARLLMDTCIDAAAALKKHQNQCAALTVVLINRLQAATRFEANVLTLGSRQHRPHMTGVRAGLISILNLPEGMADRSMDYATTLVNRPPATLAAMSDGWLAWDHTAIITDETNVLPDYRWRQFRP